MDLRLHGYFIAGMQIFQRQIQRNAIVVAGCSLGEEIVESVGSVGHHLAVS